ncbi:MAG: hypothetical protein AB1393_12305 [Candidatus Edwardsbacteria bacterium]
MKKLVTAALLVSLVLLVTSVFAEMKVGVVQPLGISIYMQGTHMLVNGNHLVCLLESSTIDLTQYEGFRCQVSGPMSPTVEGGQQIMDVQEIKVLH